MIKVSAYVKKIPREKENDTAVNIFFLLWFGIPARQLQRWPLPGPGLAARLQPWTLEAVENNR